MLEDSLLSGPRAVFCLASTRHASSHSQDILQDIHKTEATLLLFRCRLVVIAASAGTVLAPQVNLSCDRAGKAFRACAKWPILLEHHGRVMYCVWKLRTHALHVKPMRAPTDLIDRHESHS